MSQELAFKAILLSTFVIWVSVEMTFCGIETTIFLHTFSYSFVIKCMVNNSCGMNLPGIKDLYLCP